MLSFFVVSGLKLRLVSAEVYAQTYKFPFFLYHSRIGYLANFISKLAKMFYFSLMSFNQREKSFTPNRSILAKEPYLSNVIKFAVIN